MSWPGLHCFDAHRVRPGDPCPLWTVLRAGSDPLRNGDERVIWRSGQRVVRRRGPRVAVPDYRAAHRPDEGHHRGARRAPAPIGDEWEEVVEASFRPETAGLYLVQWAGEASWTLPLAPIDYRVRYSATGMDRAREQDTLLEGEPLLDRYLLQLWPAPPAPDAVIRETSEQAAYWHAYARTLPPPPTPQERTDRPT